MNFILIMLYITAEIIYSEAESDAKLPQKRKIRP